MMGGDKRKERRLTGRGGEDGRKGGKEKGGVSLFNNLPTPR